MFLTARNILSKIIPSSVWNFLVRKLPNIEIFLSNSFRGIDKIWHNDEIFMKAYKESSKRSLLDIKKAYVLYTCAKNTKDVEGVFAELGVYKGAGSKLMLEGSRGEKDILLIDTFEGLPSGTDADNSYWKEGKLGDVNFNDIKTFLKEDNFKFYKGFFPESAKDIADDTIFSFVHIDFDLYQSTLDGLKFCYEKMSPAGVMLIDDYGVLACPGVKKAVDDFFSDKPEMVMPNLNGQCVIVKI